MSVIKGKLVTVTVPTFLHIFIYGEIKPYILYHSIFHTKSTSHGCKLFMLLRVIFYQKQAGLSVKQELHAVN